MGNFFSKTPNPKIQAQKIRQDLYQRVKAIKQKYQQSFNRISNEAKTKISKANATQLVEMLDQNITTSQEIILCFIQRCCTIGINNNYILDQIFQEAIAQAKKVDIQRQKYIGKKSWKRGMNIQQCFPPFFGIPISIKETIILKQRQIYCGFVSKINPIHSQDFLFIMLTKKMGFIPFVRTNVSQGCKSFDTTNNIFGFAKNPWKILQVQTRSPGGSSGGEGGLIASGCSAIGIGTDIGGSLRIPAQWNGLYTIMANYRITRLGNGFYGKYAGGFPVKSVVGFISKSTKDHITILDYFCDEENYKNIHMRYKDPYLNIKPFNYSYFSQYGNQKKRKMKIGFFTHLPTINCSKSHQRIVNQCARILQNKGHEVTKIELPKQFQQLYFFMLKGIVGGAKDWILKQLSQNQPLSKQFTLLSLSSKIPWLLKLVVLFFLKRITPRFARILQSSRPLSVKDYTMLIYDVQVIYARKIYQIFANNQLDIILSPGFAHPAAKSGSIGKLQYSVCFSAPWNVIHYPSGTVPVSLVRQDQTQYNDGYNDIITKNINKYAVNGSQGLPVGIQLISTPYNQEKILYLMNQLQNEIKFRQKHPYPIQQIN